ncbi:MAG: hypothetical protein RL156_1712 [Bacteroidota bacterium]|jgi:hypothetical protein
MALTTFQGPVRSLNGFYAQGPGSVVNVANNTNTLSLTVAAHAGKVIRTNDATLILTLPAIIATADSASAGPGSDPNTLNNIGTTYTIVIDTAATAVAIKTNGTDKFIGSLLVVDTDSSGAMTGFAPAASNDVINLDGSTTGGAVGSIITITALSSLEYLVQGVLLGSGTIATPFADA